MSTATFSLSLSFWVWGRAEPSPAPHVGDVTLEWSAWRFRVLPSLPGRLASDIDALVISVLFLFRVRDL